MAYYGKIAEEKDNYILNDGNIFVIEETRNSRHDESCFVIVGKELNPLVGFLRPFSNWSFSSVIKFN